jgi:transposase-like protein
MEFDAPIHWSKLNPILADEDKARLYLEHLRWGATGAACPHCGGDKPYKLNRQAGSSTRNGVWKCRACRKQFTVTVGTVFEASHIPITKWLQALYLITASKKGISAHQLHRMLGITYKSAWFMAHRLRYAMSDGPLATKLVGIVEADETYVGGRRKGRTGRPGPGDKQRTPVIALVERNGRARAFPMERVTGKNIHEALAKNLHQISTTELITDESGLYGGHKFGRIPHSTVNHSRKEYVRGHVHTNTVEGFLSLLKRGIFGVFHHVSKEHLARYCDEFAFRYSERQVTDAERAGKLVLGAEGKRLTYKQPAGMGAEN